MRFLKGIQKALEVSVRFFKVTMRFPKLFGTWRLLLDVTFQILRSVGKGGCNIGPSGTVFVQRNL